MQSGRSESNTGNTARGRASSPSHSSDRLGACLGRVDDQPLSGGVHRKRYGDGRIGRRPHSSTGGGQKPCSRGESVQQCMQDGGNIKSVTSRRAMELLSERRSLVNVSGNGPQFASAPSRWEAVS